MKNILLLLILFTSVNVIGQKNKELTTAEVRTDFDVLRKALEEAHSGLYRFAGKQEVDKRFDAWRTRFNHSMSQLGFISVLWEILAETRDGHLRLEYDETTTAALTNARLFPFVVLVEGDRLMVVFNDTPHDSIVKPGMEILTINGHTAKDLMRMILPKTTGDGFSETCRKRRFERMLSQRYWLFVDQAEEFTIIARNTTGKTVTTKVAGVLSAQRENNRAQNPVNAPMKAGIDRINGSKENIALRFVSGSDIASLRIRMFIGANFRTTLDSVFQVLHDQKTRSLILDLRGNGGGADDYGAFLVSQFTDKPFRYFDRIHITTISPSFATWNSETADELRNGVVADPKGGFLVTPKLHSGVGEQQPAKYPFMGQVIILIDGSTFSTAADATAGLHQYTKASFVGEESGGTCEGNTSGLNALLTLPNSKLKVRINIYEYWNAVSNCERGRGTKVDFPVELKMADILKGIDTQWEYAMKLASTKLNK